MIPHKTERGKKALRRFKAYEGCPPPFDHRKRYVVPGSMRIVCLKPGRSYCKLGRLSHEVGWKYQDVVKALETKRKVRAFFEIKKREALKVFTIGYKSIYFLYNGIQKVFKPYKQFIKILAFFKFKNLEINCKPR